MRKKLLDYAKNVKTKIEMAFLWLDKIPKNIEETEREKSKRDEVRIRRRRVKP